MRGWVRAGLVVGGLLVLAAARAAIGYGSEYVLAAAAVPVGRWLHIPLGRPKPPVVLALPAAPVTAGLPWLGSDGVDADGYPQKSVDMLGMRALLLARRFDELTRYVEEVERDAETDVKKEYWAHDATTSFDVADPALGPPLDAWVKAVPRSAAPYLCRGAYRLAMGWNGRGNAWARDTSVWQQQVFRDELARGREDLEQALKLNPHAISAYIDLIEVAHADGSVRSALARGIAIFPDSFLVRYFGMLGLTPRWGGSYEELERLAAMAAPVAAKNTKLRALAGFPDYARGEDRATAKDYAGAIPFYDRALGSGEIWLYLDARGDAKNRLHDYAGAFADLGRARAIRPQNAQTDRAFALASWYLKEHEQAAEAYLHAVELDPTRFSEAHTYATAFEFAGRKHWSAGEPREALAAFDKALLLDPNYPEPKRWRAQMLAHGDPNANQAQIDALVARAEREDSFDAYLAVDDALAKSGRFAEIIRHWTDHLTRNPTDGAGFVERGGAYTHVGRFDEALADVTRACDLGVARGCALKDRVPEMRKQFEAQRGK
ncbi:MAG TPA: DUF4034 domain-containing protein [Polyangiaceae bacterium]|nr:DUF4034 domain-containing protein [Polyangiaceae bacterium]